MDGLILTTNSRSPASLSGRRFYADFIFHLELSCLIVLELLPSSYATTGCKL